MKYILSIALCLMSFLMFTNCRSQKNAVATFNDLNGEWNVVELNGNTVNPEETGQFIKMSMSDKRLSGNAGCNRIIGSLEYDEQYKNIIKFPRVGSTRMACPDMKGETELLGSLQKVVRFESASKEKPVKRIALYGTDNTCLLVLEKR